jgi:hypothetical protein
MVVMDGLGLYWIINWRPCTLVVALKAVQTRQVMRMFLSNLLDLSLHSILGMFFF